jgi:hypothetical protein
MLRASATPGRNPDPDHCATASLALASGHDGKIVEKRIALGMEREATAKARYATQESAAA